MALERRSSGIRVVNRDVQGTGAVLPDLQRGKGLAIMLVAVACIAGIDPSAKLAGQHLPVLQVVWGRYAFAALTAFVLFRPPVNPLRWGITRPWMQCLRAGLLLGATGFNFLALQTLDLVENQAIVMLGPLVITLFSLLFFGERLKLLLSLALLLGFLGALVVIRPAGDVMKIGSLYALGHVGCYAFYVLLSKQLLPSEGALGLNMMAVFLPGAVLSVIVWPQWTWPPDLVSWSGFVLVGVVGGLGHFLLVLAHRHAPASTLAPLAYTQLLWAFAGDLLIFRDVPDMTTVVGAAMIVVSGIGVMVWGRQS